MLDGAKAHNKFPRGFTVLVHSVYQCRAFVGFDKRYIEIHPTRWVS